MVEKETYKCSDCEKHYAFLNKLQHHKPWSCKKKKEVKKIAMNHTRRPLSSNVFSVKRKEGDIGDSSVARDKPAMIKYSLKVSPLHQGSSQARTQYLCLISFIFRR